MAVTGGRRRERSTLWRPLCAFVALMLASLAPAGCNSIRNGWLDPTVVGSFEQTRTMEIRASLSLEDSPGIPGATYPTIEDSELIVEEYPISGGDTLAIEINELRQRQVPFQTQVQVSPSGFVNLPVVGRLKAAGLTPAQFQEKLAQALRDRNVLLDPEVTVNPLFLSKGTYSIFGVGVSAANNAPLRAGTFPIRRPDLRLLEAINQVGGLNEFVTEVYIFRRDNPNEDEGPSNDSTPPAVPAQTPADGAGEETEDDGPLSLLLDNATPNARKVDETPAERELIEAVVGDASVDDRSPRVDPDVMDELEPQALDAYVFVNGAFVPNPAFTGPSVRPVGGTVAPRFDTVMPAVNWARIAGDTTHRVIMIPAELLRAGDLASNIYVRAGDVIRIVSGEIGAYYVMGQVNRVGAFAFNAEPVRLKAAIASAGGLSALAWPDRCTIYRKVGNREQMIQVNLDRIFAGQDSDVLIRRGDIINVGTHPFAPFLRRIRQLTLPNPTTNVGYAFTYARNFADVDSFAVRQNPHNKPDLFPSLFP